MGAMPALSSAVDESQLLELIRRRSAHLTGRAGVVVGPGDDCAVLDPSGEGPGGVAGNPPEGAFLLATVDQLVEGRHYDPRTTSLDLIARKAVARSISDIAAMGGTPTCALAAGCLRDGFEGADELFERMHYWGNHFACPLAGGDIAFSDGPTVLGVTVLGRSHPQRGPVLRSTAGVGDVVCVTGRIGGSFGSGRHLRFEPRIVQGVELCDRLGPALTSMMDISDGLGRDAGRVGRASGVTVELEAGRVPIHADAGGWKSAIADGEDYELLFTVAPGTSTPGACGGGTPITAIGRGVAGPGGGVVIDPGGSRLRAEEVGWDHVPGAGGCGGGQ